VRIAFNDGTHIIGYINLHSKHMSISDQEESNELLAKEDLTYKFNRTSDFLKNCNPNESMITVFDAKFNGKDLDVCFVFLHSVKFITEEKEVIIKQEEEPEPQKEDQPENRTGSFLRNRIKRE
jgi:hypothetical protein